MLRVTQQDCAKGAKSYYATADYYCEGQEIVGLWGGRGAQQLGLEGVVDKQSFERLCDNLDPRTGNSLTVRTRSERTVGYDFTFSVPKSVSLRYALQGDQRILDAFRAAVNDTMQDIEAEMQTRVRKGKQDENRVTSNAVWAEFIHTTSRPIDGAPDPQLHAHCFVFNSTWDPKEKRWKAGQFRELKRDAPYFQAAFRVRLANNLQDLGLAIERKRDDFELAGFSPSLLRRFSKRTEKIEQVAADKGITDPDRKAELGAETREKKNAELSWGELLRVWDSQLTDQDRHALAAMDRHDIPHARPVAGEAAAVDFALSHCYTRESAVSERKLVTVAMQSGLGAVTVEGIQRELTRRPLIRAKHDGQIKATTPELRDAEQRLLALARAGRGRYRPLGDPGRPITREPFSEEQKAAVRHVLASRDFCTVVRGAAGTGKTTTAEAEIGLALAEAGMPAVAMAQSTGAVEELRENAGFANAVTIAHFLKDTRLQSDIRGGVILVDEASMVGTRDLVRLFELASDAKARIILIGDIRQHRSVSAGEPLKLLEQRAGLPVAQITEIIRQQHGDYRKAAKAASDGKAAESFAELDRLGWIREIPHAGRYWVLAQAYLSATLEKKKGGVDKTSLVVSPTHAEIGRVTHFIRAALKADGRLGEERTFSTWVPAQLTDAEKTDPTQYEPGDMLQWHKAAPGYKSGSRLVVEAGRALPVQYGQRFAVYRPAELALAVRDRVRVTANGKTKDGKHRLTNGVLFTVQGFTKQGDLIVDHGWVIDRQFGHLGYGYAVTSQAAEGKTVDKVFVAQSSQSFPATNERSWYVPITRGREQCVVFTDNKQELLRAIQRPDEPLSATELAERASRKAQFAKRLKKHLASLRRLATFAQDRKQRLPDPVPMHKLQREVQHVR